MFLNVFCYYVFFIFIFIEVVFFIIIYRRVRIVLNEWEGFKFKSDKKIYFRIIKNNKFIFGNNG